MEKVTSLEELKEITEQHLRKELVIMEMVFKISDHNYIREHEALKGQTPAEKCGIKVEGKNKWKTLIENASAPNLK